MPIAAINAYAKQLPRHKAELQMLWIEAACAPYLAADARKQRLAELERAVKGEGAGESADSGVVTRPLTAVLDAEFERLTGLAESPNG